MELRMKNFNVFGIHRKIQFYLGRFMKNQYIRRNYVKRGAWTVCKFKEGLTKRGGGVFEGGS